MEHRKIINNIWKVSLSLFLGSAILYWMYRDFDLRQVEYVMLHDMNWTWMLLSFPFGIAAQLFRGLRWKQTLEPMGEAPRTATCCHAVFISYAVSLLIPRIGEFARCGILRKYDKVSFPKALGTVVTERAIDSLLVLLITVLTLLSQVKVFGTFFTQTGTSIDAFLGRFTATGYFVTALCLPATAILLHILFKRLSLYNKVKETAQGIRTGIISVKNVRNIPLFIFFTLAIWASYFLHYYLAFFCFESTSQLGPTCALVTFIVGSIAVIVPTPNGAGPWHFAVKTMLILYGVTSNEALNFVLIVHSIQTLLVIMAGIYAWIALSFTRKSRRNCISNP